jgi:putative ABC transport system ATP-binding protein
MEGIHMMIEATNLTKSFRRGTLETEVLKGVTFSIPHGEFVAIMGPSGSGKSTFMNILGCLDQPTSGKYFLDGADTGQLSSDQLAGLRNRTIGFVFQGFNLLPRARLTENVALPLVYAGIARSERNARAVTLLERIGLAGHVQSFPNQISGGQQQRVAIARALATRPRLLLADEPTGNLDTHTGAEIMNLFTELNRDEGITVVLVTHDQEIAAYARRLVRFRDGIVEHDGPVIAERAEAHV